jgi:hypothetical protein
MEEALKEKHGIAHKWCVWDTVEKTFLGASTPDEEGANRTAQYYCNETNHPGRFTPSLKPIITADYLRSLGWSVAVHNDYKQDGKSYTFWLFTSGIRCAKGEGRTDDDALRAVVVDIERQPKWSDERDKVMSSKEPPGSYGLCWLPYPATDGQMNCTKPIHHVGKCGPEALCWQVQKYFISPKDRCLRLALHDGPCGGAHPGTTGNTKTRCFKHCLVRRDDGTSYVEHCLQTSGHEGDC